ncbi:hypothetical protein DNU06_13790 [Putridiphycobacter roseus]|uniref:Uncharacterized protein n=1 Tax=Putridiphycobacter roseus TaxID=2219161 RepID=A0A2W1MYS3_9FLAO|nr:hypothetical protein [Putridiphycobacter roseus]PZE16380.1 hypothetical protein DNU06_13790 [Putridiphycobacter roseus]
MKQLILLLVLSHLTLGIGQKTEVFTFEDGNVVELTNHFDDPYRLPDWHVAVDYNMLIVNDISSGLTIKPKYIISDEIFVDGIFYFSIFQDYNKFKLEDAFLDGANSTINMSSEIHYTLVSSHKFKEKKIQVDSDYDSSLKTSYLVKTPLSLRKALLLDGGINYSQFTVLNNFYTNLNDNYYVLGQSALSLTAGLSYYKTRHYKLTMNERTRNILTESSLSLKVLFGTPTGANIAKETEVTDTEGHTTSTVVFDPATVGVDAAFNNFGFRLSFDRLRAFGKHPNIFFNWGVGIGIEPSYQNGNMGYSTIVDNNATFLELKFGLGFGKVQ